MLRPSARRSVRAPDDLHARWFCSADGSVGGACSHTRGPGIRIWTQRRPGTVTRVRNFSRVQVAPCTRMGNSKGETVEATARLLDTAATRETLERLKTKYDFLARAVTRQAERRLDRSVTIEVVKNR